MKYSIIGGDDEVLGFGMVGVAGWSVKNADEARAALQASLDDTETGIIIITEAVAGMIRDLVDRYVFTRAFPLIVEIPGREGPSPDRPGLRDLVNQAIGINL